MENQHVLDSFFERSKSSKSSMTCDVAMVKVIAVGLAHLGARNLPLKIRQDIIG
jgi:hypothetical protein